MADASGPARHQLLWVEADAWREALAAQLPQWPQLDLPVLRNWAASGRPLIARRPQGDEPEGSLAVGVPLPPSLGKLRIALHISPAAVVKRRAWLPLRETLGAAPRAWRPLLDSVLALGQSSGFIPAVFGSLLWQHLTGLEYLSATSDLDLLWPPTPGADGRGLLHGLAELDQGTPRLDGELLLAGGQGVQWRELHQALRCTGAQVLVKSLNGVQLKPVAEVLP